MVLSFLPMSQKIRYQNYKHKSQMQSGVFDDQQGTGLADERWLGGHVALGYSV